MGNGHGGARRGSGPKLGPDGKALKPYERREQSKSSSEVSRTPVIEAKMIGDVRPQRPMFSEAAVQAIVEAMREMKTRSSARPRTRQWNPYIIRPERFGYGWGHLNADKSAKQRLAMDDNTALTSANQFAVNAWQAGGLLPNDASEGLVFLGYPYLAELAQRPEFRLFGEIMSEEMTRKWIEYRGTDDESTKEAKKPKDRNNDDDEADARKKATGTKGRGDARNKEIERKIVELRQFGEEIGLRRVFKTVAAHNSDFGMAHLYVDLKGANVDDPRDPENRKSIGNGRNEISQAKLGVGCLQGLRTIEPVWCYPTAYNASNPLSTDWYDPLVWYVMGAEIHKTRLLPFVGRPVSDILKPAYAFGGLSMTQMAQPYVDIWLRTRESVGEIIHAFSVMILSTNMGTQTQPGGSGGGAGDVVARMMLANMLRDNQGMMVIDKATEDFKNISAPISGLDELQAQSQEHLLSVSRIPAVKYTGNQPKGLNASSEGEMRAFNDTVHGQQEHLYRVGLTSVVDIMQISLWGKRDPDITFEFLPLHEETMKEKAEVRKTEAETDQIRIDSGVVDNAEVRAKVVADPESGYHGLDPDDVPDLLEEEEGGLIPPGAGKGVEAELANAKPGAKKPAGGAGKGGGGPPGEDATDVDLSLFDEEGDEDVDPPFGANDEWNEGDHPRSPDGKFGSGGASSSGGGKARPINPHDLKKIGGKMGSNEGGTFEDKSGAKFYIKRPESKAHVKNELAAARLYELAGVNTLDYREVEGGNHVATALEKLDKKNVADLTPEERKEAQRDFMVHAWLSNWDAAGTGGDNQGVLNGKVTTLDVGGSLRFRAQGGPKGAAFGPKVSEIETMRDPSKSYDAAKLFGKMNEDDLTASAKRVTSIPDEAIRKAAGDDELAEVLIARKNDVAKRFGLLAHDEAGFEEGKHPRKVLFKANTFFLVHKVEVKGGTTHIEMEEVESHG
jgi:uncharacterized protein